jgi:hypothetical protein
MTKSEAIQALHAAGVNVWGGDVGKCRVYGTQGGYLVLTREGAPDGSWALKPATSGGYRQFDAVAELAAKAWMVIL